MVSAVATKRVGVITLGFKVGPKLVSIGTKLLKSAKVVKVGLAAASMASYTLLFSWKFALAIMLLLFVHESGHVWAMRRIGIKTKGFYFIPFIGGAAVAEQAFPNRWAEVYVAIMGPIWGLALSMGVGYLYVFTEKPIFAAIAGWMAAINLFNLLPVNPLDGGRILKSITFSIHSWVGLVFLVIGLIAAAFLAFWVGFTLFFLLLFAGGIELIGEWKRRYVMQALNWKTMIASIALYLIVAGALFWTAHALSHVPGADIAKQLLQ